MKILLARGADCRMFVPLSGGTHTGGGLGLPHYCRPQRSCSLNRCPLPNHRSPSWVSQSGALSVGFLGMIVFCIVAVARL